ncbi:Uncharacterized protein PECH_005771 [Penicillium ucsense]|uniref:Uncharacterized protein n=1 Tax=Penicillium ucsense TaxID=2839758 RepID=A0A8J8WGW8_9EURO|nr:Uncharacterized protein PECM_006212 [Penicillium ucsense]KAF7736183.1 Uncharacterized protein PECH_005771 [Penicillium ucsense]
MASPDQLERQIIIQARQRQLLRHQHGLVSQAMAQEAQRRAGRSQPRTMRMSTHFDDLPIVEAGDVELLVPEPACTSPFDLACRDGPLSTVIEGLTCRPRTPAFLHRGLLIAMRSGNLETAQYLLTHGAPISRHTPELVLRSSPHQKIELFELFMQHGWTPNSPGLYGAVILPSIVEDLPLLSWFLTHGANPNLGPQQLWHDRLGPSETEACVALETASARGSFEAVKMLLEAGARLDYGTPLHSAAGACLKGTNPHAGRVTPSKEFDIDRIPVMRLLVEQGADVNQKAESRHMIPQYAIVHAVMAGAFERVKWLLAHGADPHLKGSFGSAIEYASFWGPEMRQVIEEGLAARNESIAEC